MITQAQIQELYLSTLSGSAGNSVAGTTGGSLGKYISTTAMVNATMGNLFRAMLGDENAASQALYRCVFFRNASSQTAYAVRVYFSAVVAGGADFAIGLDTTAASDAGSASAQALSVADEFTAPAGVSFSAPTDLAGALSLGDIPAGQVRAVWVRMTGTNSAAKDADGATITIHVSSGE